MKTLSLLLTLSLFLSNCSSEKTSTATFLAYLSFSGANKANSQGIKNYTVKFAGQSGNMSTSYFYNVEPNINNIINGQGVAAFTVTFSGTPYRPQLEVINPTTNQTIYSQEIYLEDRSNKTFRLD